MRNPSESSKKNETLREALIGLGERSLRKSYYPVLQERLRELERFKAFLDHSNDAIFLIEVPTAKIIDINDSSCRQLGWCHEELLKLSIFDVSDLGRNKKVEKLICDTRESAKERLLVETTLHKRDGGQIPAEITLDRMLFQESAYVIAVARDITKRKRAEEALRRSEENRYKLQTELECAAKVQTKLLPDQAPDVPGFEFAARCVPAYQIGGDFYDWQKTGPGLFTLTLGDVMGKGMAAAMLMATVRASLRAVSQAYLPAAALQQTERALRQDLDKSESFVTLFHARLSVATRCLTYVDCGHGYVFMLRSDGRVEELLPRGLPLGVLSEQGFQEGELTFELGDTLVLFSDGLLDIIHELDLDDRSLAKQLWAHNAEEIVDRLLHTVASGTMPPDDMTLVVVRCKKGD